MPKIYVACLASYNNGHLHGEWFDLDLYSDADDLKADIREKVLLTSPYPNVEVECPECEGLSDEYNPCPRCGSTGEVPSSEEYAVHDYDNVAGEWGEYPDLAKLLEHVQMVEEHGEAWNAFVEVFSSEDPTERRFRDSYVGEYSSEKDFAMERAIETGMADKNAPYFSWIDWQDAWDSYFRHGYTFQDGHVFHDI